MEHEGFLRDICEHPDDDTPRLVYADWLEEQAGPASAAQAAFLRVGQEIVSLPDGDRQRVEAEVRLCRLAGDVEAEWRAVVSRPRVEGFALQLMEIAPGVPWFRGLYDALLGYEGERLFEEVLRPWVGRGRAAVAHLAPFRTAGVPFSSRDDFPQRLWNLYALSRVSDYLLLPFQADDRGPWARPGVSREEYQAFFTEIGLESYTAPAFCPFYHEIVRVREAEDRHAPVEVLAEVWPGLMLGDLLFCRAGVVVRAGMDHAVREVAEQSTLYFSHWRLHRRTEDLSAGWGSNSQWRTPFRRDYRQAARLLYNVDGEHLLTGDDTQGPDRDGLTLAERVELCRNRSFVTSRRDSADLWPYDDRYEEEVRDT